MPVAPVTHAPTAGSPAKSAPPAKGQPASGGYRTAKKAAAKQHAHVAAQRADTGRKWAKRIATDFDRIAVEDFRPRFLAKSTMARKAADDTVIRSPIVGGSGIISGNFTTQSANDLALLLRAGALPAPLKIIEERSVGPSLGADSIKAGAMASIIGIALVVLFMVLFYGLFGMFANIAMIVNAFMTLTLLAMFDATLTLPGIAGIVLTVGMAVDANVLIYERMREELRGGKSIYAAVEDGFKLAFGTIFDSHVTTLSAALILYSYGTGTVKGFAVTLAIGIICSLFTAVLVTRFMVVSWLMSSKRPKALPL